ncbi:MAG: 16S rRNA (cytosine(1402)-N(4))-methyltransferase RsmH [Chloroflexi bacterium]|nr:16S rRNA (cytosine(1402)-N(4))-methyltransferase RsmH [Chloroflexota bacterium]
MADDEPLEHSPTESTGEHVSVFLDAVVAWLAPNASGTYVDCTLGDGGHAAALLTASSPSGRLLGLDADANAVRIATERLEPFGDRAVPVQANFRDLANVAAAHHFRGVDGIVIDLGLSSRQLEGSGRGFSFRREEPLDMRFDPNGAETAAGILARADEEELADLLYEYGEERRSRRVARQIVRRRERTPLVTTGDLVAAVVAALGPRRGRIHPATRTFQALRIAVNDELAALDAVLPQAAGLLAPGGRLAVISFHSLEDRRVKRFFVGGGSDAPLRPLMRRPLRPDAAELARNPRARSAKLRVAERMPPGQVAA